MEFAFLIMGFFDIVAGILMILSNHGIVSAINYIVCTFSFIKGLISINFKHAFLLSLAILDIIFAVSFFALLIYNLSFSFFDFIAFFVILKGLYTVKTSW